MASQVTFELPAPLGRFAGQRTRVTVEGETVGEAVSALCRACPDLGRRLLDETGAPRRFFRLLLNGDVIALREGLASRVHDGDRLTLLLPIAGG